MMKEYTKRSINSLRAFDVFDGEGNEIDTVFYGANDKITPDEVRQSLINHDGYPEDISVVLIKRH